MSVTTYNHSWAPSGGGVDRLWGNVIEHGHVTRRVLFTVQYEGRDHVAFGGGRERWRATDHRYYLPKPNEPTTFSSIDEAKAWVGAVLRLEGT